MRRFIAAAVAFWSGLAALTATGQSVPADFWGTDAMPDIRQGANLQTDQIQFLLLWLGFYYGEIDGDWDDETRQSVERFQSSLGATMDGYLTAEQEDLLRTRGQRARSNAGFEDVSDEWTGITVALPLGYLSYPEVDPDDKYNVYYYAKGSTTLEVRLSRDNRRWGAREFLNALKRALNDIDGAEILMENVEGNEVRLAMQSDGRINLYIYRTERELRGIKVSFEADRLDFFSPIFRQIIAGLRPFEGAGLSETEIDRRIRAGRYPRRQRLPEELISLASSGSGSVVSYQGHILTNHHVVSGCQRLTVNNGNPAVLLGVDVVNDLALIRADRFIDRTPIRFRDGEADLGETIIVIGYPVFSMSQSMNVTEGIVSSNKGLFDDRTRIQITAPVQPGNSGGPVLDLSGHQVAVVVSKASAVLRFQRDVENMSWVIRSSVAQSFLRDLGVRPLLAPDMPGSGTPREVAESAGAATVRVECHAQ